MKRLLPILIIVLMASCQHKQSAPTRGFSYPVPTLEGVGKPANETFEQCFREGVYQGSMLQRWNRHGQLTYYKASQMLENGDSAITTKTLRYDERSRVVDIVRDSCGTVRHTIFEYSYNDITMYRITDSCDTIEECRFFHRDGKMRGSRNEQGGDDRIYDDIGKLRYTYDSRTGYMTWYNYPFDTLIEKKIYLNDTLQSVRRVHFNYRGDPVRLERDKIIDLRYEYDRHGSWTRQTSIVDGQEKQVITRRITYYK